MPDQAPSTLDAVALRRFLDGENPDEVLDAPIGLPGGEASRTAMADIGPELPDVREILERLERSAAS